MKTINQVVGENLKKIRELSGFTQEEVAKSIGIERSAYSNYEGGDEKYLILFWKIFQIYSVVKHLCCLRIVFKRTMKLWLQLSGFQI